MAYDLTTDADYTALRVRLDEWRAWRDAGDAMFEGDPDDDDDDD